jgi:2-polyprenyl-3-methyl-5-hydroxy-6-metoxy-1,4-benzoquinol methylase
VSDRLPYDRIWARKLRASESGEPIDRWVVVAAEFEQALRLLDIGCGDGRGPDVVRGLVREIVGVDVAVAACKVARQRGLLAVAASLNGSDLPFAADSFDAVTCLDVIEHLLDPVHVLSEIARLLRPGGHAYVSTVNMRYLKHVWWLVVNGVFPLTSTDEEAYDGGHLHYFTSENIRNLGRRVGLRPIRHVGVVPSARLQRLQPLRRLWPVREFFAAGFLVVFRK